MTKRLIAGALALLSASALAQEYVRPPDKEAERRLYHGPVPPATPAREVAASYARRQAMKASSHWGGLKWRNIGPEEQGGRVVDIETPGSDPDALYVAFATGGFYRTRDAGATWTPLFDDQPSYGIGDTAVSRDGKTLWVGTGEANSQRTSYAGTGVYKSTDEGKTWSNVGLPESHHIAKVLLDPRREDTVYVAVLGRLYGPNAERGVYKTTDGGKTWRQTLKVDDTTGCVDLALDPSNPDVVYAAMLDRDRRAWNFRESGKGSAVYRSADGGKTWAKIAALPSGGAAGRVGLATSAADPARVYAFYDNQTDDPDFAYRDERAPAGRLTARRFLLLDEKTLADVPEKALDDFLKAYPKAEKKAKDVLADAKAGKPALAPLKDAILRAYPEAFRAPELQSELWRSDDHGKTWRRVAEIGPIGGYYWGKVFVDPKNADDVTVTGVPLLRSTDGGTSWKEVAEDAHVDHHAVWYDPRRPGRWWIGNDGGLYETFDYGKNVRHVNNLSVAQATTVAVDNKRPYNVIVGLQDNGTRRGPSNSRGRDWTDLFGGDGSAIAVDPRDDGSRVYVAYQFGQHFAVEPGKEPRYVTPKGDDLRFQWISPFLVSKYVPDLLYMGSQKVHRSFDQGKTWEPISGDLTTNRPQGDVPFATIKDLSESPIRFGLLYAGTDDGRVWVTPDGGYQWSEVSTPAKGKWVSRVVASRWDVNTVYVAQNGYREDDATAYLWKSTDAGKTWTSLAAGLPAEAINVVREDPKDAKTLYVGTDRGVYVTFDGGATFETLHGAFPNLPVHDLAVQERDDELVAATHARGAYVVSLKPLRRITPKVKEAGIALFDFDDVKRRPTWSFDRRDRWDLTPPTEPTARGAVFVPTAGKATLRLLDKAGKEVLTREVDLLKGWNAVELSLQLTPERPAQLDRTPRRPEDALKDPYAASRATYVGVGEYTLEVTQGGLKATKPFRVTE